MTAPPGDDALSPVEPDIDDNGVTGPRSGPCSRSHPRSVYGASRSSWKQRCGFERRMPHARFGEILEHLAAHEVDFVVVEMTAGILQGAPVTTVDLDIVHRRTPANVTRLLGALEALDSVYRHDARGLRPKESHLRGPGHQLLATKLGDLDCLGTIDQDRGYDDLLEQTEEMELASGRTIRVLSLPALIDAKERSGRPKDLAALPVLRATLEERDRASR